MSLLKSSQPVDTPAAYQLCLASQGTRRSPSCVLLVLQSFSVSRHRRPSELGKVQLSDHEKGVIDGMHRVGTSARTIAKSIGRSNRTVSKWIARLKALGHMERQDGSGCPRKTTALQDRRIMLVMKRQRDITVGEIQESASNIDYFIYTIYIYFLKWLQNYLRKTDLLYILLI